MRRFAAAGLLAGILAGLVYGPAKAGLNDDRDIPGFSTSSLPSQHNLERRLLRYPSSARIQADHRYLTEEPHVAGTPRDRVLAEWTAAEWRKAGLEDVRIVEHE